MKKLFVYGLLLYAAALQAQPVYPVTTLPVLRHGTLLNNAWTGGVNSPQFSPINLNNDGFDDLFVFDRVGEKVLTFINDGSHTDTAYHYAPQYEQCFPPMHNWALVRDYNHDGIPDIFTYQPGEMDQHGNMVPMGIKVYKGSRVNGNLRFDVLEYCLQYTSSSFTSAVFVNSIDIPSIVDVNNDGDLDILAFGYFGSEVTYYENQMKEQGRNPDSLLYLDANSCWGNFSESASGMQVTLNISCKGPQPQAHNPNNRHVGAGLCPIYNENNRNINLLLGGIGYDYMYLANNCGDSSYANMCWVDTLWPNCDVTLHMPFFPTAYQVDADNDGHSDLLVAPNAASSAVDVNNVMLFRNVPGDTCNYQYTHTDSFLVRTFMDFGTDSKGVFFDYNGDGLMDMVVGNYGYFVRLHPSVSQLALYRNTGTPTHPVYTEVTTDYAGLSAYSTGGSPIQGMNPAFGDLDADGKPDMILGDANGYIHFLKNTGDTVASFPVITAPYFDSIDVGAYAAPFIYDLNGDSLPDLIIGRGDGKLSYYWNYGTATNPHFSKDSVNSNLGNVNVTLAGDPFGNSQPFIYDSAGVTYLLSGSYRGTVFKYLVDAAHVRTGAFTLIDSDLLHYDAGAKVTVQAFDLNADGKPEYLLGNSRGGLQLYSQAVWDSSLLLTTANLQPLATVVLYPNPATGMFTCIVNNADITTAHVELLNMLGQPVAAAYNRLNNRIVFNASQLPAGMYLVRITAGEQTLTARVLIQH